MNRIRKTATLLLTLMLLAQFSGYIFSAEPAPTAADVPADTLTVHYIDVGQADCALLECGGHYALIDGGNVEDSSLVVSYLERTGVTELEAVFCSHAHEDHAGGLPGVLSVYPTGAVYAPTDTYASKCFDDFLYYTDQQGLSVTIPSIGDTVTVGGATVEVLGPVKTYADTNNTSLVLMVTFGENRFLFTGDMETDAETDLLDAYTDVRADVLKVGHHGSNTSTGYRFLYEVSPRYAVISVGTDNTYGHPHREPLSRLRDAGCTVYRTDRLGTVIATGDGSAITFRWEKAAQPDAEVTTGFIGNRSSKKVHSPSCANLPQPTNRTYFETYTDALRESYTPCSQCLG